MVKRLILMTCGRCRCQVFITRLLKKKPLPYITFLHDSGTHNYIGDNGDQEGKEKKKLSVVLERMLKLLPYDALSHIVGYIDLPQVT
jgi:hypothetical protein